MNSSSDRHPAGQRELQQDFVLTDSNHDRVIDFDEFVRLLQELEADMSMSEMRIGFSAVDTDHDGRIDYREFIDWWTSD